MLMLILINKKNRNMKNKLKIVALLLISSVLGWSQNTKLIIDGDKFFLKPTELANSASVKLKNISDLNKLSQLKFSSNLKTLELENCQIASFPEAFSDIKELTSLSIINDSLITPSKVIEVFSSSTKLKNLTLVNLKNDTFPAQINLFNDLRKVVLRGDVTSFHANDILNLDSLKVLDLGSNYFTDLPKRFFSNANSLEVLYLDDEKQLNYKKIEPFIEMLPSIKELHIEENKLSENDVSNRLKKKLDKLYLKHEPVKKVNLRLDNVKYTVEPNYESVLIPIKN